MKQKVFLAAGGTGGHIYPAIAVAHALQKVDPNLKIQFWGATKGLENKIIPKYKFPLHRVVMGRLNHNVSKLERLFTLFLLPLAMLRAFWVLLCHRPRFVLGFGGHASAPLLLMASLLRIPTYIWEPNALPGLTNRKLSGFVTEAFVVFEKAAKHIKCPIKDFGLPIRREIVDSAKMTKGPKDSMFNILVYGGSQGARFISDLFTDLILSNKLPADVRVLLQTGPAYFPKVSQKLAGIDSVQVTEYIHDMGKAYQNSDLAVTRAGTGTLSELASVGLPSVLIPLPTAADNHQFENAKSLADRGGAIVAEQATLDKEALLEIILQLKQDSNRLQKMSESVTSFYRPNSAQNIAKYLVEQSK